MPERTSLELLVLVLVARGLATPYDLNSKAGLSVAATIPVLKRLKSAGLVISQKGPRRSQRFTITSSGGRALRTELPRVGREIPSDIESVLRIAYILWITSKKGAMEEFLRRAATDRRRLAGERRTEAEQLQGESYPPDHGFGHRRIKAVVAAAQLDAEGEALERLTADLPSLR